MSANLEIWESLERTDPRHVKEITGKPYKGNSPRPHWVIWKLTEKFGPVGRGFGWEVIYDNYVPGIPHDEGHEQLHEVRILFWWRDGGEKCSVESYGATKALYKAGTKGSQTGYWVSDEDAAKKSLTDAITKAASWLGVAADIFMGRWDDSKYVSELKAESSRPARQPDEIPLPPPRRDWNAPVDDGDNPPSVAAFLDQVKESMDQKDVKDSAKVARAYAVAMIVNIGKRAGSKHARHWFDILTDLHSKQIGLLPEPDRTHVRNAIAFKRAEIDGENPDPAEFGYPFGEPAIVERMAASGTFSG
jgi:hypothetical protein